MGGTSQRRATARGAPDPGITTVRTATGSAAPARELLQHLSVGNWSPFAQHVSALRIARPAGRAAELLVPIGAGQLTDMTHLSCRFAKEHDAQSARVRAAEPLRNFALALFTENGLQIGRTIAGSAVPSIVHRVYPVRKWTDSDGPPQCYPDTRIFLQTVEVPLTQFLAHSRHTASDLGRVRELRFPDAAGDQVR